MKFLTRTLIFISLVVLGQLLLMLLAFLFFDINLFELDKNPEGDILSSLTIAQMKFFVSLNQFAGILLPACLYLVIMRIRNIGKWLGADFVPDAQIILIALGVLLFSYPVIAYLMEINQMLDIPSWMDQAATEINEQMEMIIQMESLGDLVMNILLIALLPAVAEELFFRGVIQNELKSLLKKDHLAVWLTAIIFSSIHFQFDGFLPRLGLGLLLGYSYLFSRNFFIPFLLHFVNNGIMVTSVYFRKASLEEMAGNEIPEMNLWLVIISFIIVLYLLFVLKKKNKEYGPEEII